MKNFFVLFSLSLAISSSAQTLNKKGLYINDNDELLTGKLVKIENGIKTTFEVKDGIVTGEVVYYYASGKVMETGYFNEGQKDKKWIRFTENGEISAIAFYAMGKKTGTWIVFDNNGKKRLEMNYSDGQKTGIWTSWDENGAVVDSKDYSRVN